MICTVCGSQTPEDFRGSHLCPGSTDPAGPRLGEAEEIDQLRRRCETLEAENRKLKSNVFLSAAMDAELAAERRAWETFAAAAITRMVLVEPAAEFADAMIHQWAKRYGPKT